MQEQNPKQGTQEAKSQVWDCESRLYDSYELKSFNQQLDSSSTRTFSMPHTTRRKPSKITRSIHKLVRLVFGSKPTSYTFVQIDSCTEYGFDRRGVLPTIPEVWEKGVDSNGDSPEFDSIVRKTASERFTDTAFRVSQV